MKIEHRLTGKVYRVKRIISKKTTKDCRFKTVFLTECGKKIPFNDCWGVA